MAGADDVAAHAARVSGGACTLSESRERERSKYSYTDPARFASLTALYSQFAQSDEVRALVRRERLSRIVGSAAPVIPEGSSARCRSSHSSACSIAQ